jgi:hypothetical protein
MYELRYTSRDLKGDIIAGTFNGGIFGLVYSFYFLPIDRLDPKIFSKCRNSALLYTAINLIKMGAGFAIMRTTYNCVKKQDLGTNYEIGSCMGAFALICTFM